MHPFIKDVLTDLFDAYIKSGGLAAIGIDDICRKYNYNPIHAIQDLVKTELIKNVTPRNGIFPCQISNKGIKQIAPRYFPDLISRAYEQAAAEGDWIDLASAVGFASAESGRTFDLSREIGQTGKMEVKGQLTEIQVKLTASELQSYQDVNGPTFRNEGE